MPSLRNKETSNNRRPARSPRPNAETIKAIQECEDAINHPEKYKWYSDVDEMMKELLA